MLPEIKRRFLDKIKGPVFPVPIPFNENGSVDLEGLKRYVLFLIDHGASTIMVTAGTSRFDVLTIEEMKTVNQVAAETAEGKAIVIVTTPTNGPTSQAVDFAMHAESVGADAILVIFPDRYYTDASVVKFFKDVAGSCSIGIMIHLKAIPAGKAGVGPHVQYSLQLVDQITEIENLVGMKEESLDQALSYKYSRNLSDKMVIIGGAGGMRDYLTKFNWGQQAYLVGIGNFVPHLEERFYKSLVQGDLDIARKIIFKYEAPFFDVAVGAGWHLALKEAMAFFNLMKPWERPPLSRISQEEQNKIINLLRSIQWVPM
ncbi:dihydrodipicolinate synthase family protein [bacterium]|nr:dihydrodipicolinate synthase family protein [bacterium]